MARSLDYEALSRGLDDLISAASGEDELDERENEALMGALMDAVPALASQEVRALQVKLERAMEAIQRRCDAVAERLGEIKHSRRALNSYDHIKTFDKEPVSYTHLRAHET